MDAIWNQTTAIVERIRITETSLFYLALLFMVAGLSVAIDSGILVWARRQIPVGSVKTVPPRTSAGNTQANYDVAEVIGGPIFQTAATAQVGSTQSAAPQSQPFILVGTLEGDPVFARAVIREVGGTNQTREIGISEHIGAARLIYIGREYIWIKENGQKFKVKEGEQSNQTPQVTQVAAANPETAAPVTGGSVVKRVISREEVNKIIKGNPAEIYKDAAFGPLVENGKIKGYKIYKVAPSHVFYQLGARAGDVIEKVNNFDLSDTESMFELWKSIKTAPRVSIDLIRGGQHITYDFHIRN